MNQAAANRRGPSIAAPARARERIVVASPIYKHHFDLRTGECLEDPEHSVSAFATRVENGEVWVAA
jgi:nitrite reductase/ring-hydroxylating ferredoxin subunit